MSDKILIGIKIRKFFYRLRFCVFKNLIVGVMEYFIILFWFENMDYVVCYCICNLFVMLVEIFVFLLI